MRDTQGCTLTAGADRARDNRRFVRVLLAEKQPGFAALLEALEAELACPLCRAVDRGRHRELGRVSGLRGT